METPLISRRAVVGAGLSLALAPVAAAVPLPQSAAPEAVAPDSHRTGGFALGCQAYTYNRFTVFEAIEKTAQAGGKVIEFYPGQRLDAPAAGGGGGGGPRFDHNSPDDAVARVKEYLEKNGVRAVAYGVVGLGRDEAANRRVFEYAKKMGITTITSEPDAAAFDVIEKLVKEYDVRVAIHNHPKQDRNPNYRLWDPDYVLSIVKSRDSRIGACADTGHWARSGVKPVDGIRKLKERVLSLHLKDVDVLGPAAKDVPFGTGVADMPAMLAELKRLKVVGPVSIEYERGGEGPVWEVAQCVGFVRGWSATKR